MQKVTSDIFGLKWAVFVELQLTLFVFHFVPDCRNNIMPERDILRIVKAFDAEF